jgi:glycosyltransferase involved in cell wall biosynthesis
MTPLVSVLIDTYNHEGFIEDAIRSVLGQDFPADQMEILVVDDASTDRTPEIVRKFEPQVRLLRKPNGGQASAINHGVANSQGEFVAFLDGDDVWLPNKLSRVIAEFENNPEAVLVYHKFCYWDSRDGHEWEVEREYVSGDILKDRRKLFDYWAAPTSSLVFNRAVLNRLAPVPEQCSFNHDTFLTTAAIFLGPVAAIPERLAKNRVHGQNLYTPTKDVVDPQALRRRLSIRAATIEALGSWMRKNIPRSRRPQARYLLRKWQLVQDSDAFLLSPPTRYQQFVHLCRHALVAAPTASRGHLSYCWAQAFGVLVAGKHARYLEGARTRIKKLRGRPRGAAGGQQSGQTAGGVP